MNYLATMRKKNDKSLNKKYTFNNNNSDEVEKILNDYITVHNKKVNFFINCEFVIEFDNNFTTSIETNYFHGKDTKIIRKFLL